MGSLQDALLKAGLADEQQIEKARSKPARPVANKKKLATRSADKRKPVRDGKAASGSRKPVNPESDLARAYKARQRAEAQEKEAEKERRVKAQEERRQRNLKLDAMIKGSTLNRKEAELPRYFEHMGRIRRVLCTPEQRDQLNRGEIGVVNLRGSYLLVALDTLEQYREIAPDLVPDLAGRDEPEDDGSHYPPVP
ncbi:MAG: DUF2058 family protein, partial [Wenzhouxiangella sp.]